MGTTPRLITVLVLATLAVGACGHSRVARRDYPANEVNSSRHSTRPGAALPGGAMHRVRAGETLYGISFRYGLRFQDVAVWNSIRDPYVIHVGQQLRLRAIGPDTRLVTGESRRSSTRPRFPSPNPPSTAPRDDAGTIRRGTAGLPSAGPLSAGAAPPGGSASNGAPSAIAPGADPGRAAASGQGSVHSVGMGPAWRWPAKGQIIGRYVAGDQTRQGINIAGSAGQDVAAAADGVVVYSGAGLVGYGELIIIKHSDEWLSAYAHNRRRLVEEGTRVRGGESIAEMGRTGAIREMLHFEIRRNGKPVDPLVLLPRP